MAQTPSPARSLRGDLFGGITAGIVALPLALAFGVSSGLGAEYGLYGAIFIGFFAAIFGGTAVQISGPTGPMTVVTAGAVAFLMQATDHDMVATLPVLVAIFVLAGLMQIGMGLTGVGTLIKFIPYPVVSGFMSGIGVIIVLPQLFPAVGMAAPDGGPHGAVMHLDRVFDQPNLTALLLCTATIVIIYGFPRLTRAVPSALVALVGVTMVSALSGFDVPVIGDIPSGLPPLHLGGLLSIDSDWYLKIIEYAATLAALGAIDSLLTSVVADNLTKTRHSSNRELIGQGIGNTISGLFAGLPGAGATMRTVVNIHAGGRTRLSGAVHALLLLGVLLGAGAYAAFIPHAVLAGILITVGVGILDYKGLRHLNRVPRADAAVMIVVLLVTVLSDLLDAVGIGMVMAAFLFMRRMAEAVEDGVELEKLSAAIDDGENGDREQIPDEIERNVLVKRITGPVFFGFAQTFQKQLQDLPEVRYVILRLRRVPFMDQTGAYSLEEAVRTLERRGVTVLISGMHGQPRDLLRRLRIVPDSIPNDHKFERFEQAVDYARKKLTGG